MPLQKKDDPIVFDDVESSIKAVGKDIQKLSEKTIVITGAAGFVCSYFVDFVALANQNLSEPCKIIAIDNFIRESSNLEHLKTDPNFSLINHDIRKPLNIDSADFIIHGASIASPTFYRKFPVETMDVNTIGTRNMLELASKCNSESFLFISTSEVYGDPPSNEIPTKETYHGNVSFTGPRACYDESKRFGETLCTVFHEQHGIPVKITRPFNFYGPRLSLDDKRVIPDFIRDALSGNPIKILSNGKATRTFCYISDAVSAHFKILLSDKSGEAFNVGNASTGEISMHELALLIGKLAHTTKEPIFERSSDKNYLTDNPERRCPDCSKIESQVGWKASTSLEEGLRRTIEWHRQRM